MVKNIKGYFGNLKDFVILRGNRYMAKCCYEIKNFTGFKHFYEEDDIDILGIIMAMSIIP